jgi:hypothetical protein
MGVRRRGFGWSRRKRSSQKRRGGVKIVFRQESLLADVGQPEFISSDTEFLICDECLEYLFSKTRGEMGEFFVSGEMNRVS